MLIEVRDASQSGEARRMAVACAEEIGLDESTRGAVAIVVTEMATNLVKHAGHGSILISQVGNNGSRGMRVLALDKGPGVRNISQALQDGHSTAGTMGTGLGAIQRMSENFEIYSGSAGTVITCEFWPKGKVPNGSAGLLSGTVSVPFPGEEVNGDGWITRKVGNCIIFMIVDGLGHGPLASEAAREAESIVSAIQQFTPTAILQDCHDALKNTRGAAMSVAIVDLEKQLLHFAGIGNVSASIVSPDTSRSMACYNGTLGHQIGRFQEFSYPWNPDSTLIMHSDGLNTRWNLKDYPGILNKQPAVIAGMLYRDFVRGRDDVTVLVAKNSA